MSLAVSLPFIIYWLLVKDFFHNIDVCESSNNEPGHCMSDSECNVIFEGTEIGSCDSKESGPVCCKITLNYFNETYLLNKIFVRKSQTDKVQEMVIFNNRKHCSQPYLEYGNKGILVKSKETVYFNSDIHVSKTPDRIMWPIWASYSRNSRNLKKTSAGTNLLYVIEVNKVVTDAYNLTHLVSECLTTFDEDSKFYLLLNKQKTFIIKKFFTRQFQKLNKMNLTNDASNFINEFESEQRSRRSIYNGKQEESTSEKQHWKSIFDNKNSTVTENAESILLIEHNTYKEKASNSNSEIHNRIVDGINNYTLNSSVVFKDLIGKKSNDKENEDEISYNKSNFKKQFTELSTNNKYLEEKRNIDLEENFRLNKTQLKGDARSDHNVNSKSYVYDDIQSEESGVIHKLRKLVQGTHDMLKSVQLDATHDMRIPVKKDKSHDSRMSVKVHNTYDLQKPVKVEINHDLKQPVETGATYDMRNSVKKEYSHGMLSSVQIINDHDMRKPVEAGRVSVQTGDTHNMRKSLETGREFVQARGAHNMRKPVETGRENVQMGDTHNMRKPVETGRENVQMGDTHNIRKPMETAIESVQTGGTHNMRNPVTLDESHDLRWPVLESENDLRNLYKDSSSYGNVDIENIASDSKRAQTKLEESKYKIDVNENMTLTNSSMDCNIIDISLFSKKSSSMKNESEGYRKEKIEIWEESSKVCGKYFRSSTKSSGNKSEEKWPFLVSLHENVSGRYIRKCSASLLNNYWVITVAHCVDMKPKEDFILVTGNQNLSNGKGNITETAIDEIIIHPKFNRGMFENDLALLRMKTPVTFQSTISPICLLWSVKELKNGIPVYLGRELKKQHTNGDLQIRPVPILTNSECEDLYSTGTNKETIKDTFLCAGKDDGNCDSESGSSLVTLNAEGRWSLIGLVSWGSMCTNPDQPSVYIRISSYAKWIKDVIICYETLMQPRYFK